MDKITKICIVVLIIGIPFAVILYLPPQSPSIFFDVYDQCNWEKKDTVSSKDHKANPELLINWEKDRLLKWSDFKGEVEEGNQIQACTYTQIFYDKKYKLVEGADPPLFYYTNITATAYFRVYDSWVESEVFEKKDSEQSEILKHEQGHFDIAEEHVQKFLSIADNELIGKTFPVNGTTPKEIEKNTSIEATRILKELWDKHKPEWNGMDEQYDDDVKGIFGFWNQWKYNERFDKLRENSSQWDIFDWIFK